MAGTISINEILNRLKKVRKTGQNRWISLCPAHDDRIPSLAIRMADDGTVLMHCFTGCSIHDITSAIGINIADLFPNKLEYHYKGKEKIPFDREAYLFMKNRLPVVKIAIEDMLSALGERYPAEKRNEIMNILMEIENIIGTSL